MPTYQTKALDAKKLPFLAPLTGAEQETFWALLHKMLASMETTNMDRCTLCRLCDDRVCTNCPIPADKM